MKWSGVFVMILAIGGVWLVAMKRSPQPESAKISERSWNLHREHDRQSFFKLETVEEGIDFGEIDGDLLDAAVFHETNRRRVEHGLKPLEYLPRLRRAARVQAESMRQRETVSHDHPDPELKTAADRVRSTGLRPAFVAENVASAFGLRYESGSRYYKRRKGEEWIISAEPGGPPIPPHTYASFARDLVDGWMNSPGHRENILHKQAKALGVSCQHRPTEGEPGTFYCAQEFFAALF